MDQRVRALKNQLANYLFYRRRIVEIEQEIKDLYYALGVHGVQYDKEPNTPNYQKAEENRIRVLELIEDKKKTIDMFKRILGSMDEYLLTINEDDRQLVIDICIKGKTYDKVAEKNNISKGCLQYKIDKILKKGNY